MYLRQNEGKNRKRGVTAKEQEAKKQSARASQLGAQESGQQQKKSKSSKKAAPSVSKGKVVPIVIVPPAQTSKISLLNAADLLDKGLWVPLQQKKDQKSVTAATPASSTVTTPASSSKRKYKAEVFVHVSQREDGSEVRTEFEVVQDTSKFEKDDWNRVIAIFTNGKEWEFKGWKLGDPATMFHRVPGFYVAFKVEPKEICCFFELIWFFESGRGDSSLRDVVENHCALA